MATTPRPYLWQFVEKRADEADGVGGVAHYFTKEAQTLYLHNGIVARNMLIEEGHWENAEAGDEINFNTDEYSQTSWTHPATGAIYGSGIVDGEDEDTAYLLRYIYAKDMGHMVQSAKWDLQIDNPIAQLSATLLNYDSDGFTKQASLFVPGTKAELGLTMGNSAVYMLGTVFLDEIDFQYAKSTVPINGRNRTGYILYDSTFNAKGKRTDTATNIIEWVLAYFGIEDYEVEEVNTQITFEYEPSTTGLSALQDICDRLSGFTDGTDFDIEERWDGLIVIGFNAFRGQYLPKQVFEFGDSELFKRSSNKSIDGAYSKIYCTGKDANGHELTPVCLPVTTWAYWNVVPNKTYFAPMLEGVTQAELERYAAAMAKQIKRTGLNEGYNTTIKPQLLVGDYATVDNDGNKTDIGIITQVTHTLSEKGYFTDFVADSGGDKKSLLTRSSSSEGVYTSARRNSGDNRTKRLIDFIRNTAQQVVRSSGAGSGGGDPSEYGVLDVEVDGVSVVNEEQVAEIDLTGKQDVLTVGDRIAINSNTISADIEPFSIVDGKMCITHNTEV